MASLCDNACTRACQEFCQEFCQTPAWLQRFLAKKEVRRFLRWLRRNCLLVTTVIAVAVGLFIGAGVRGTNPTARTLMLIGYPGELFLRALNMMTIPIIIASVVSGTAALDPRTNGRMSGLVIGYFIISSLMSACLGMFLVIAIHPGNPEIKESAGFLKGTATHAVNLLDSFMDLLRNVLPDNLVAACLNQTYTAYVEKVPLITKISRGPTLSANVTNETMMDDTIDEFGLNDVSNKTMDLFGWSNMTNATMQSMDETKKLERIYPYRQQTNVLGLIVFFSIFGAILSTMGDRGRVIAQYFYTLDKIIMIMVRGIIWFMPIGVTSLICKSMAAMYGKSHLLEDLVLYCLVVVFGLAIHQFILLPLFYFVVIRKNPFKFYWNNMEAIITAFATESSSAALPVTIQNMIEKNHANKLLTKFVLPIGATINMNGTAIFVAVATMFIAQMNEYQADASDIITVIITSTAVSLASSATPGAALTQMAMSLSVLPNVPLDDIKLLLIIDWLLGRCRTTNNVVGDCFTVAIFEHVYRDELKKLEEKEEALQEDLHPFLKH